MSQNDVEKCSRCGKPFSTTEQSYSFEGIKVCSECDKLLRVKQTPSRTKRIFLICSTLVICAIIIVSFYLLKNKKGGNIGENNNLTKISGSYKVDYKLISDGGPYAIIATTINGPAAYLAVILTDPKGEPTVQRIPKEMMITNSQTVRIPMYNLQEGTWVLSVKTIEPEKVVWQKKLTFTSSQPSIKDIEFGFIKSTHTNLGKIELNYIKFLIKKNGNLPIKLDFSVSIDGKNIFDSHYMGNEISNPIMIEQEHTITIDPLSMGWQQFKHGEHHSVKGKIFYGKDNKSLDFEKEFIVPQK